MQKPVLGKGINALIPENATPLTEKPQNNIILYVSIDSIKPNIYQPRKAFDESNLQELADSIKSIGIINPLIVREEGDNKYQLIAGERRWRAAKLAGISHIPVIVQKADNQEMLEVAIIENIQRVDLNALEEAEAYQALLKEFGMTHEEIAEKVGKNRSTVTNTLRLLKLPFEIKDALRKNIITMGHARALLALEDNETEMLKVFKTIINDGISVRETELLIKKLSKSEEKTGAVRAVKSRVTVEIRHLEEELMEHLGTKVSIKDKNHRGKIIIEYYSLDDFERLMDKIKK
ncbi:MAG TPA: ParB/RepB/Spo0J family partition protein [bacterium]|nr:ParB/RepB/Spo0J family partition protein [bacterium]